MRREYEEAINEMLGLLSDSETTFGDMTDKTVVGLMLCRRLDRIADSLDRLAALSDCITESQSGKQLCIVGSVVNYGP